MAGGKGKDDHNQSSGGGGGSRKTTTTPAAAAAIKGQEQQQVMIIKCPRCDSQNTKFCYYNNYSLTQPRHFCKTCRRYWTNGGALRNVPIGGGCRKNKKSKSSNSSTRLSFDSSTSRSLSSDQLLGGLKFFQGISPLDFQLGGGLNLYNNNHLIPNPSSFGDDINSQNPCFNNHPSPNLMMSTTMINFPFSTTQENNIGGGGTNYQTNLASSIESLSSINQDLHWKLQQQRLAMLFSGGGDSSQDKDIGGGGGYSSAIANNQIPEKQQPTILFHNLEGGSSSNKEAVPGGDEDIINNNNSRKESGNLATEWFFDPTPTSSSTGNENVGSWNEIQAWNNLNQYI